MVARAPAVPWVAVMVGLLLGGLLRSPHVFWGVVVTTTVFVLSCSLLVAGMAPPLPRLAERSLLLQQLDALRKFVVGGLLLGMGAFIGTTASASFEGARSLGSDAQAHALMRASFGQWSALLLGAFALYGVATAAGLFRLGRLGRYRAAFRATRTVRSPGLRRLGTDILFAGSHPAVAAVAMWLAPTVLVTTVLWAG